MALPEFNGFSLQDSNFITSDLQYRTWPSRQIITEKLARRPGTKLISEDFGEKHVKMSGWILGSSVSDLQTKIDSFYAQLQKPSKLLQIETNRFFTATCTSVSVGDPHYSQTYVPFELDFVCADPFAYGPTVSAQMTVTSGTIVQTFSFTVSGSYFAEPIFTYTPPTGAGNTTTSGLKFVQKTSAEYVLWSGSGSTNYVQYGSSFQFDYQAYKSLFGTTQVNQAGVFSRWEVGSQQLEVTFMGNTVGGTLTITYAPRYL